GHSEPVVRAGSGERNDMAARFQHAHDLFPELDRKGHLARIPRLTHEARRGPCISVITLSGRCVRSAESLYDGNQSIGGIANHAIHAIIWHLGQHVPAVPAVKSAASNGLLTFPSHPCRLTQHPSPPPCHQRSHANPGRRTRHAARDNPRSSSAPPGSWAACECGPLGRSRFHGACVPRIQLSSLRGVAGEGSNHSSYSYPPAFEDRATDQLWDLGDDCV